MLNPRRTIGGRGQPPGLRLTAEAINERLRTLPTDPQPRQRPRTAIVVAQALGVAIESARLHTKLTQEDVAVALSLDRSAIARWELGERTPTVLHLLAFSDLVNVSVVDLLRPVELALRRYRVVEALSPLTPIALPEDTDAADD